MLYTRRFLSFEVRMGSGLKCGICLLLWWICSWCAGGLTLKKTSRFWCYGSKCACCSITRASQSAFLDSKRHCWPFLSPK